MEMKIEYKRLMLGLVGLLLSACLPLVLPEGLFGVLDSFRQAAMTQEHIYLLECYFKLAIMNLIRTTPIYLSCFFVVEAIRIWMGKREIIYSKALVVLTIVNLTYRAIGTFARTEYAFGAPAVIITLMLTILIHSRWCRDFTINKVVITAVLFLMTQALNSFPDLTRFGFGGGELSRDLHSLVSLLGYSQELTLISTVLLVMLLLMFCMILVVFRDHYRQYLLSEEQKAMESQLNRIKMESLTLRTNAEISHIVHDLKSPLTTIIGLGSLTQVVTVERDVQEYAQRIMDAADVMNEMIHEVLHEDRRTMICVSDLIKHASSYIASNVAMSACVRYQLPQEDKQIKVNRIRLTRALINLVENAYVACHQTKLPQITIGAEYLEDGQISLFVEDNGCGIAPEQQKKIWEEGYSGKNSSGIGLIFVKSVVSLHGGSVEIQSEVGKGTKARILLKEEVSCGEKPF